MENSVDGKVLALIHIASAGPSIGYKVFKGTPLKRSLAYKYLKEMEEGGWLRTEIVGKTNAGLDKKAYGLTVLGLCHAFRRAPYEAWDILIERWSSLMPLVLGKWRHFSEVGVEDLAHWRLERACLALTGRWMPTHSSGWMAPKSRERLNFKLSDEELVIYYFYDPWITYERNDPFRENLSDEKMQRWLKACTSDSEISAYYMKELERLEEGHNQSLKEVKLIKEAFHQKESI